MWGISAVVKMKFLLSLIAALCLVAGTFAYYGMQGGYGGYQQGYGGYGGQGYGGYGMQGYGGGYGMQGYGAYGRKK